MDWRGSPKPCDRRAGAPGALFRRNGLGLPTRPADCFINRRGHSSCEFASCAAENLGARLGVAWEALRIPAEAADRRSDFVRWTALARRHGTLALEPVVEQEDERLIRLGLRAWWMGAVRLASGTCCWKPLRLKPSPSITRRGFEAAGGYAPTMGVLGAVLGLIHALQQLDDPQAMGPGVATAFLATLYGLALANLVLLPLAGRLRLRADARRQELLVYLEGVLAVGRLEHPVRLSERRVDP